MTMTQSCAINIGIKFTWLSLQTLGFEMASRCLQFLQKTLSQEPEVKGLSQSWEFYVAMDFEPNNWVK